MHKASRSKRNETKQNESHSCLHLRTYVTAIQHELSRRNFRTGQNHDLTTKSCVAASRNKMNINSFQAEVGVERTPIPLTTMYHPVPMSRIIDDQSRIKTSGSHQSRHHSYSRIPLRGRRASSAPLRTWRAILTAFFIVKYLRGKVMGMSRISERIMGYGQHFVFSH